MLKRLKSLSLSPRIVGFLPSILILAVTAIAYLPFAARFGYYFDDWYLMYDAHSQGTGIFPAVFASDRPARAYLMQAAYSLFGDRTLYYHLGAFAFRYLAALAFWWTLGRIFPKQRMPGLFMALLYAVYPGFLSQVNAIDFQSHIAGLCFGMLSVALTAAALQAGKLPARILIALFSVALGVACYAMMEYYVGLEIWRLLCIFLLIKAEAGTWLRQLARTLRLWAPFALAPAGFLVWRLFFFTADRQATDVGFQLGQLLKSPALIGSWWLLRWLGGAYNSLAAAWAVPAYTLVPALRLKDLLAAAALTVAACALVWLGLRWFAAGLEDRRCDPRAGSEADWRPLALIGGVLVVLVCSLPVIAANREIDFDLSRYTLPGSAGAVMAVVAGLYYLSSARLRNAVFMVLVGVSVLTHQANSIGFVHQTESVDDFWWQASWRAPSIAPGTLLVVHYPLFKVYEDYAVWGPANLIYYPEKQAAAPVEIQLTGIVITNENVSRILAGVGGTTSLRRGNFSRIDYSRVLVVSQPSLASCVHFVDGGQPVFPVNEDPAFMLVGTRSRLDLVSVDGPSAVPPPVIFGAEPPHGWCYFYQKASLAAQRQQWETVAGLADEAAAQGYRPDDRTEWMPFLQAYVALGRQDLLQPYVSIMSEFEPIRLQACRALLQTARTVSPSEAGMAEYLQESMCH